MTLHPGSKSVATETLLAAGIAAPEIRHLLELAHYQGRIERHTGPYVYVVTFDGEAGYQVTREGEAPADDTTHTQDGAEAAAAGWLRTDQAPAVDLFSAEWPYPQLSAADFAAVYTAAAGHIRARGYYAHEVHGYADEDGISITGALKLAALEYATAADPADTHDQHMRTAHDLTEELETRLSAVLYVFGQAHTRTGINDLSDVHVAWSLGHFTSAASTAHGRYGIPTAAHALALLEQAARMFGAIADDTAPVTEAPAPTRM